MGASFLWYLVASPLLLAAALPQVYQYIEQQYLSPEQGDLEDGRRKYVLPVFDATPSERADQIKRNREGYLYGPSRLGNTSYFPSGLLGDAMVKRDVDEWYEDAAWVSENVAKESQVAATAVARVRTHLPSAYRRTLIIIREEDCRISRASNYYMMISGSSLCQAGLLLEHKRTILRISFSPWKDCP